MIRSPGADREQSGPGDTPRSRRQEALIWISYLLCFWSDYKYDFRPCKTLTVVKIMSLSNKCKYSKVYYLFVHLCCWPSVTRAMPNQILHSRINPGNFGKISLLEFWKSSRFNFFSIINLRNKREHAAAHRSGVILNIRTSICMRFRIFLKVYRWWWREVN